MISVIICLEKMSLYLLYYISLILAQDLNLVLCCKMNLFEINELMFSYIVRYQIWTMAMKKPSEMQQQNLKEDHY